MSSPTKTSDQAKRFKEMARELECDEDPKAFEKAFAKVVPAKHRPSSKTKPKRD